MLRRFCLSILCLAVVGQGEAFAHGQTDAPLYVAADGVDRGRCDQPEAPCRSISYALRFAGKGGRIRVAEGTYRMDSPEDLFHIVGGLVEVSGGFRRGFAQPATGVSVLTGIPHEYRELLDSKGFHVIADTKATAGEKVEVARKLARLYAELQSGASAAPCVDGSVSGLACDSVDLLSHVAFADISARPAGSNDVWGFVDLNTHREYAIAGFDSGTGVFDVTDPAEPREVGFIDGQSASWRDIKVMQFFDATAARFRAYAYVTTDGASDGLFVIDLTGLPQSVRRTDYVSDFSSAHNVYVTNVDYATGVPNTDAAPLLIIAGANLDGGAFRAYDLSDPARPRFVARGDGGNQKYMHDAASLVITDARKDTQCFGAAPSCQVLLDFNEDTVDVWDVTDPGLPRRLSSTPYANSGYTHSGWPSEDGMFMFVHDELDEQRFGLATTLRVFSLSDLRSPDVVGSWNGSTAAIDHNGFVRGNRYYMSNYSRGLTVLDISDPSTPVAVGRLDTYPFSDESSFVGAWGAYPFFWSGNVAISDIGSGLYLAADRSRDVAAGKLSFAATAAAAPENQQVSLTVRREGGTAGIASVDYEVVEATADASDYTVTSGMLSWPAGDAGDRTIDIAVDNDGVAEGMERLIVRLISPGGGATLGNDSTANVYISDAGAAATVGFLADSVEVAERGFAMAVVTLARTESAVGAVSVDYSMTGGDASPGTDFLGATSGTVTWEDGDANPKSIEFAIVDDGSNEADETFTLSLNNAVGATLSPTTDVTVTVFDGDGPNVAPNAVAGASQTIGEGDVVRLDGSQSNDPDGDALTFAWTQLAGPAVSITNPDSAVATFTAPNVDSDAMLRFRLTVTDPSGLSSSSQTTVTVLNGGGFGDKSGGGAAGLPWLFLLCLPLLLRRPRVSQQAVWSNGWRLMMVCSLSGPVEMMSSGTPTSSSIRAR